jgi:hypothetical protein
MNTRRLPSHLKEHSLIWAEEKGSHSGIKGCKDQLLIKNMWGLYEEKKEFKHNIDFIIKRHLMLFDIDG